MQIPAEIHSENMSPSPGGDTGTERTVHPTASQIQRLMALLDDENRGVKLSDVISETQSIGIDINQKAITTRSQMESLLSGELLAAQKREYEKQRKVPDSIEEGENRDRPSVHLDMGIDVHPQQLRRTFFASLSPDVRQVVMGAIEQRMAQEVQPTEQDVVEGAETLFKSAGTLQILNLNNLQAINGLYIPVNGTLHRKDRVIGHFSEHLLFVTNRKEPLVLTLKWEKKMKPSKAMSRSANYNNCCGVLEIINLHTNEVMTTISISPQYSPEVTKRNINDSGFFEKTGYSFFGNVIAARLLGMEEAGLVPATGLNVRKGPREMSTEEKAAFADNSGSEQSQRIRDAATDRDIREGWNYSLSRLNGGETFQKLWEAMPWERDLRQLVESGDMDRLIEYECSSPTPWDGETWPWEKHGQSVPASTAGFRGASR